MGVFSQGEDDLGFCSEVSHNINTTDNIPVKVPHRRVPPHQWDEVRRHLQKLMDSQVFRESSSPYASPVVLVSKHDGSMRMCVDYRALNAKMEFLLILKRLAQFRNGLGQSLKESLENS